MLDSVRLIAFAKLCRSVAVGVVARPWPGQTQASLEGRLAQASPVLQVMIVGGLLGVLLLAALVAAQFGWVGLLAYFVAIILLVG